MKKCLAILLLLLVFYATAIAGDMERTDSWAERLNQRFHALSPQWGGHLKLIENVSWPREGSYYEWIDTDTQYDTRADFRLKNALFWTDRLYTEIHYEIGYSGGDSRYFQSQLDDIGISASSATQFYTGHTISDDLRLLHLTHPLYEDNRHILYHRLDRLSLTYRADEYTIRIGRQAVTWGNGFLFNPMDLLNPFAPTDIDRDYKTGDDMLNVTSTRLGGELQILYVPRRDPDQTNISWEHSSLAAKYHFFKGATEFDVLAAYHYQDTVIGIGGQGYLGDAAFRLDATWTFLNHEGRRRNYPAIVANLDYAWIWFNKNCYGLVELYYNGMGETDYPEALADPDIIERIGRGELFTLGVFYFGSRIQMELHPLVNVYTTFMTNLRDPSGVVQPRVTWDFLENYMFTFGATLYYGANDTEFGGFDIPGAHLTTEPPPSLYFWITRYF